MQANIPPRRRRHRGRREVRLVDQYERHITFAECGIRLVVEPGIVPELDGEFAIAREEGEKVASRDRLKEGSVEIEDEEAERLGLEVAAARAVDWCERVAVYGRVLIVLRAWCTDVRHAA